MPHLLVAFHARVVPHEKVVALGVLDLVLGYGPRQREDAPVCDAADYAPLSEDGLPDCLGNSGMSC
jgi:hypothetical protein